MVASEVRTSTPAASISKLCQLGLGMLYGRRPSPSAHIPPTTTESKTDNSGDRIAEKFCIVGQDPDK